MEVDAFLADSVVSAEGKLYAQGAGWDTVVAPSLPSRHPRVGVGVIVRVPYTATNEDHAAEVHLEDGDGHSLPLGEAPPGIPTEDGRIYRLGSQFKLGRPPHLLPGQDQVVALAFNFDGLVFERADLYRFVVAVDGVDVKNLALSIRQAGPSGTFVV